MIQKYNHIFSVLSAEENKKIENIIEDLQETWSKRQIFRTETEARFSVLNDGKFPTKASKYWQSVREQSAMFESLISLSLQIKKNYIHIQQKKEQIEKENDKWNKEILKIELDELLWTKNGMMQVASDRVREILMWDKIKKELDDGSFDTTNPNTHQIESLRMQLEERAKAISPGTSQAEILSVIGPLSTIQKYLEENSLLESNNQQKLKESTSS